MWLWLEGTFGNSNPRLLVAGCPVSDFSQRAGDVKLHMTNISNTKSGNHLDILSVADIGEYIFGVSFPLPSILSAIYHDPTLPSQLKEKALHAALHEAPHSRLFKTSQF
jgi:hypothetical protein